MKKACGKWVWNAFLSNAFTKEILLFKIPLCYFPWNAHWWLIYLAWPLGSNREMALIFSVVKKTVNGTHLSWWHYMSLYSIWESSFCLFWCRPIAYQRLSHDTLYLLLCFYPHSLAFWETACFLLVSSRCKCYFLLSSPVQYPAFLLLQFG